VQFVYLDKTPFMRVGAYTSELQKLAKEMGFEVIPREVYQPGTTKPVTAYAAFKEVESPASAARDCISWFEQTKSLGDAWLWITDLEYDDWPTPLPKPAIWPPAT
jgi:hypothetical protein